MEMAQRLGALVTVENPGSNPNTRTAVHNT